MEAGQKIIGTTLLRESGLLWVSFYLLFQVLDLHDNQLTSLPPDIGQLISLQVKKLRMLGNFWHFQEPVWPFLSLSRWFRTGTKSRTEIYRSLGVDSAALRRACCPLTPFLFFVGFECRKERFKSSSGLDWGPCSASDAEFERYGKTFVRVYLERTTVLVFNLHFFGGEKKMQETVDSIESLLIMAHFFQFKNVRRRRGHLEFCIQGI